MYVSPHKFVILETSEVVVESIQLNILNEK